MTIDARAARLKQARRAHYSSAASAARSLGLHPATVRSHENAQNGYPIDQAREYAKAYGVTLDWLLTGEGDGPAALLSATERLAAAREASGYPTGTAAATANGWVASTYLGHENGSRGLTPEIAQTYASAFGVTPEHLLYGDRAARSISQTASDVAERLRNRLEEAGHSQTDLARWLDLDASAVNRMCSGAREIKAREMAAIDAFFGQTGPLSESPITVTSDGRGGARLRLDLNVPMATALKVLALLEGAE